jgi:hypothetical protein
MNDNFSQKFLLILVCALLVSILTGCFSLKNVPTNQVTKMPERKDVYYFHSDDSVWIVYPIPAPNGQFTGIIIDPDNINNNRLRQVHIYAGPLSAIKIENQKLSVPMENIGKVENYKINAGMIISSIGIVLLLFLIPSFL